MVQTAHVSYHEYDYGNRCWKMLNAKGEWTSVLQYKKGTQE